MRIKFAGEFTLEEFPEAVEKALTMMCERWPEAGIVTMSGINLYFHPKDVNKKRKTLIDDDGNELALEYSRLKKKEIKKKPKLKLVK